MLRVTPLWGSRWKDSGVAPRGHCTLVEYAHVRLLVDIGPQGDDHEAAAAAAEENAMDVDNINATMDSLPEHDAVLLTNSTLAHMGNVPRYYRQYQEKQKLLKKQKKSNDEEDNSAKTPTMYATFPTVKMGQMTLYDHHANHCLDGMEPPFSLEDIDGAIAHIHTIKYSQAVTISTSNDRQDRTITTSSLRGGIHNKKSNTNMTPRLTITAHRSGHVVGGSFWVLHNLQDDTTVVLTSCNAYHMAKELHLDSTTLLQQGSTPDVLVTAPGGPAMRLLSQLYGNNTKVKIKPPLSIPQAQRRSLVESVLSVLRRDGNVLIPVDTSGRVLEVLLTLNQHWDKHRLAGTYHLVWLGQMVPNTLDFGRSQLEWMATGLMGNHSFDYNANNSSSGGHPLALRHVQCCTHVAQVDALTGDKRGSEGSRGGVGGSGTGGGIADGSEAEGGVGGRGSGGGSDKKGVCVLASGLDLDHGPARDLLVRWASNDNNAIFFTDSAQACARPKATTSAPAISQAATVGATSNVEQTTIATATGTTGGVEGSSDGAKNQHADLEEDVDAAEEEEAEGTGMQVLTRGNISPFSTAYQLLQHWCRAKLEGREMEDSVDVDVWIPRRKPLVGPELAAFLESEEQARQSKQRQAEQDAMLREVELAKGRLRLGEEEDGTGNNKSSSLAAEPKPVLKYMRPKKKSRFDSSLFLKFSKPLHLTFQVQEDAVGIGQKDLTTKFGIGEAVGASEVLEDDYGIAVIPEHFKDIVTGVDPSKFGGSGRIGEEVLRRGLGYGVGDKDKSKSSSRIDDDDEGMGEEEMDEQALEAMDLSEGKGIIRGRNGRPPSKVTVVPRRLQVLAEVDYLPLEGRVDPRAARQSVRALQPRHVVVLGGVMSTSNSNKEGVDGADDEALGSKTLMTLDQVRLLADAAQNFATSKQEVPTPSDNETVNLEVGHAAYSVRLIANPYRTAQEREQEEEPPKPIELYEAKLGACTLSLLDYVATGQKVAMDGSVVLAPRKSTDGHSSMYVSDGEVLLTDLRTELVAQGMKADYSTQTAFSQLVVNGKILVKKENDNGKIHVEGPLCEDFFVVRKVVTGQYVTL